MSTRFNNGSHYENHPMAAELENAGMHAHDTAEHNGKQDHLTGQEHTRQIHEHAPGSHGDAQAPTVGHGILAFGHTEIAELAHAMWHARGCPEGSPEQDWTEAVKQLRSRHAG
jgi:hypothetical protein